MTEELIETIDGEVKTKAAVHRDGDWHVAAHVWLFTRDGRVVLQRRASVKENWPGYWDVSAAGHVSAGESVIDAAVRETQEELGLAVAADELTHIATIREQCVLRDGTYLDNEIHEVFVVTRDDYDLGAFRLQASEVEDVRLVPFDELALIEPLVPHAEEYALLRRRRMKRIGDFHVGQHASFTKTFTDDDVRRFVDITSDVNPLHVDDPFAASTRFGRRVIHGMLTASIFSTMVGMLIPGTGAIYRSQTLNFLRPVHAGDTVTAHFVVRAIDTAKHRLTIDAWIENAQGERVIEGVCEAGLLRSDDE